MTSLIEQPDTMQGIRRESRGQRRKAWFVVALLLLVSIANFADKVVVGLAGVDMMRDLAITPAQFGLLQSSFFWLFAVGSILGGWLGGRFGTRWVLAAVAVLWAVSLAPMIGQVGFTTILACRVLLGLAEGPAVALAMQTAHSWFPANKRAVPSSLLIAGAGLGPVLAAPLLTWVIEEYSWHAAFGVLAALGAAIAVLWILFGGEGPEAASPGAEHGVVPLATLPDHLPLRRIFGTGTVIGLTCLLFVVYAFIALKVTWLPLYLRQGLGYDATTTGKLVALPYLGTVIAVVVVGIVSRTMTKRGMSNRASRGVLAAGLVIGSGLTTLCFPNLHPGTLQMALIVLSASLGTAGFGVGFSAASDVIPPKQRAQVFGIITAIYSVAGIVAPIVLGHLVGAGATASAGYDKGFLWLGVILLAGGLAGLFLINPERDAKRLAERA